MSAVHPVARPSDYRSVAESVPSARILPAALAVQLALFAAQLIIGIVVDLYAKVPDIHTGSASAALTTGYLVMSLPGDLGALIAWVLTNGPVPLRLHVVLAIVLIVATTTCPA